MVSHVRERLSTDFVTDSRMSTDLGVSHVRVRGRVNGDGQVG